MKRVYVGIDPGKAGAMSYIYPNGTVVIKGFPLIGTEYDLEGFKKRFLEMKEDPNFTYHVTIEDVKALQKPMQAGNWSLSRGKTILECMCACFDIPYTLVHSKTWQKQMWQGVPEQRKPSKQVTKIVEGHRKTTTKRGPVDTKKMAQIAAQRLFPGVDFRDPNRKSDRATSIHDGATDSVLIAEYGRRNY